MDKRQTQAKKFQTFYERLNEEQAISVNTIDGPVMVVAGPGTGKTQILSARVGKILLDTDALPDNILCLTYTDAGAMAMRKRLFDFIGTNAYRVHIHTFHAFCNDVIQDNLSLFEKTSLDAISDLEVIDLLQKLIDGFAKDNPLKRYRGDVYYETENLRSLFSTMKREGWSPDFLNQKIDEYITSLPEREEYIAKRATNDRQFQKGDVRTDRINVEIDKCERLRAAVNQFGKFQTMMQKHNRYDYDDMINWVIKVFEENANVLAHYQEQFLYVLVDEFQDTNGAQNKLLKILMSYWDNPNLFIVGDDDQSIYRFQGASIENMLHIVERYKTDLRTIVLTKNYRSSQIILDVAKTIIEKSADRLIDHTDVKLDKNIVAMTEQDNANPPCMVAYISQQEEMVAIVLQVEQLLHNQVPPNEIAILYKENKYGAELTNFFKFKNIPIYSKRKINILHDPIVKKIILVLQFLAEEHHIPFSGDEKLFEILHFDWFGIPPIEVAKLCVEANEKRYGADKVSFRQLLANYAAAPQKDLFTDSLHNQLRTASNILEGLIAAVSNLTLQNLLTQIIQQTGLLRLIMTSVHKHDELKILESFFNFLKDETHRNPSLSLQELLNVLDIMVTQKIELPIEQISGVDNGVNLLTAHGSKGLEFTYVFLVGCHAKVWEKKQNSNTGYKLPDTIFQYAKDTTKTKEDELRRLFYVAITRAKKYLAISYPRFNSKGKEQEPSMFFKEICDEHNLEIKTETLSEHTNDEFSQLLFTAPIRPEIAHKEKSFIAPLIDKFVMSATALNNYLKCPLHFYYNNLIRIPSGKSENLAFGSCVHWALERLFKKMVDNNNIFPSVEEFMTDFKWYMMRNRESFTKEQFVRRLEYGEIILKNYYEQYIPTARKIVSIELNVRNIVVEGVPLKGKLDKLEFDGNRVIIVDYKTGNYDKAKEKLKRPDDKNEYGGDYWRQAVFYKILIDNYERKNWEVVATQFDFIEPDNKKNYRQETLAISREDVAIVAEQIATVWEEIQQHNFYQGCGKEDCHWCNFVKTNNMTVTNYDSTEA